MVRSVTNEEFISHLTTLYSDAASSGSVYLTSKRLTYAPLLADPKDAQGDSSMASTSSTTTSYPLLFRLTDGKSTPSKLALSTQVSASALAGFQEMLSSTLRTCLSGCLRRRDKAKERKSDKVVAARKKKDEELGGWKGVAKVGKKRGAGHRQHQRAQKRAMKLRKEERIQAAKSKASGGASAGDGAAVAKEGGDAPSAGGQPQQATAAAAGGGASKKKSKKKGGKK